MRANHHQRGRRRQTTSEGGRRVKPREEKGLTLSLFLSALCGTGAIHSPTITPWNCR